MIKKIFSVFLTISMLSSLAFADTQKNNNESVKKMTRTEICNENMQKLFNSTMAQSGDDVEMMQILQKYIFGEVFTTGELDIKTRELLTVVSLTTQQTLPQLKAHINAALNAGNTPVEVKEAIYQCAPFIGFPKTLNAISVMNEVFKERGIKTPLESQMTVTEENRHEKGLAIQSPLYGDEISAALKGLPDKMGEKTADFLTEVCFGDFYTRKGLDIKTRELLAIAVLVTTNNTEVLRSHILGNIKAGNTEAQITAAIIQCMPYTGFPNAINALKTLKDTLAK